MIGSMINKIIKNANENRKNKKDILNNIKTYYLFYKAVII